MRYQERRPHEKQVAKTLDFLNKAGFSRVKDALQEYSSESMIHFQKLNSTEYLVVNHFDYRSAIEKQGFDLWLSSYEKGAVVGVNGAISIKSLKTSFDAATDAGIIKEQIDQISNRHTPKRES
jgi:hypothetical protein